MRQDEREDHPTAVRPIRPGVNGVTYLPPGKIATVVTFLELDDAAAAKAPPVRPDLAVERVREPQAGWYRDLFREIGEDFLWFSRSVMSDDELAEILRDPSLAIFTVAAAGRAIGMAEIDLSRADRVKIAYFGMVPDAIGTGAAQFLMRTVLGRLAQAGHRRVWLHTCTLDHPAALGFYRKEGFRPYRLAVEIADDPRLNGLLPLDAAPHFPLIAD